MEETPEKTIRLHCVSFTLDPVSIYHITITKDLVKFSLRLAVLKIMTFLDSLPFWWEAILKSI